MTGDSDKLRGCWDFSAGSFWAPQAEETRRAREAWLSEYFNGRPPEYIWRAEFFEPQDGIYTMVLHRFAKDPLSARYLTWVRVFDHAGLAHSVKVPAVEAPEEFPLTAASPPRHMPPDELLPGNS